MSKLAAAFFSQRALPFVCFVVQCSRFTVHGSRFKVEGELWSCRLVVPWSLFPCAAVLLSIPFGIAKYAKRETADGRRCTQMRKPLSPADALNLSTVLNFFNPESLSCGLVVPLFSRSTFTVHRSMFNVRVNREIREIRRKGNRRWTQIDTDSGPLVSRSHALTVPLSRGLWSLVPGLCSCCPVVP